MKVTDNTSSIEEVLPGYVVDWSPTKKPGIENVFAESGVDERYFSTEESSFFFERSTQWIYWLLREKIARNANGTPLVPMRVGGTAGRRRFTLTNLTDIAESAYQRGNLREDEVHRALKRMLYVREGLELPEIAELMPWPKDKLAKLIRAKEVQGIEDLPMLKRQMMVKHTDLVKALRRKPAK